MSDDDTPQTKGERTRQRLLEIAIDRFGERGYRATSVSEIARAAGLTQAAVYAYFANKEELFDAAVDADASTVIHSAWAEARQTPARQLVPMLLLLFITALDQHALLRRVVAGQEPEALQRLVDLPALQELSESMAERIRSEQATGEVRPDLDPELFAGGAEAILLSLLMSTSQIGSSTVARRQLGVLSIFDTVLRPLPDHVGAT
ncbi:MAG: TetR/AcrR family transcriptional regulator [Acidimicrobiia bacterium]|nr:TetR/AcrR family transcriptional regulator [Acidimicrobiia bacterium]